MHQNEEACWVCPLGCRGSAGRAEWRRAVLGGSVAAGGQAKRTGAAGSAGSAGSLGNLTPPHGARRGSRPGQSWANGPERERRLPARAAAGPGRSAPGLPPARGWPWTRRAAAGSKVRVHRDEAGQGAGARCGARTVALLGVGGFRTSGGSARSVGPAPPPPPPPLPSPLSLLVEFLPVLCSPAPRRRAPRAVPRSRAVPHPRRRCQPRRGLPGRVPPPAPRPAHRHAAGAERGAERARGRREALFASQGWPGGGGGGALADDRKLLTISTFIPPKGGEREGEEEEERQGERRADA